MLISFITMHFLRRLQVYGRKVLNFHGQRLTQRYCTQLFLLINATFVTTVKVICILFRLAHLHQIQRIRLKCYQSSCPLNLVTGQLMEALCKSLTTGHITKVNRSVITITIGRASVVKNVSSCIFVAAVSITTQLRIALS